MILDGVISPPREHLGHLGPFAAVGGVGQEEDPLLMQHPLYFQNGGIEVVVPPLSALLPQTALHELSDEGPSLRAILFYELPHQIVLLLSPRLLSQEFWFLVVGLHDWVSVVLFGDLLFDIFLHHLLKIQIELVKNNGEDLKWERNTIIIQKKKDKYDSFEICMKGYYALRVIWWELFWFV